jgi:indole-3-glycerol phosphate synthase
MKTILDKIWESKRARVSAAKRSSDAERLYADAIAMRSGASSAHFRTALEDVSDLNIIAEFKRASPSKGAINPAADAAETARQYETAGAAATSVLTEEDHFNGSIDDLVKVRAATSLPILRKDFIFDEFQIYEAAAAGADAILVIVASLEESQLRELRRVTEEKLGMDALVEVHTREEMETAARVGARLIGVNNRDLRTFDVSLDVSRELIRYAPPGAIVIAESGLRNHEELLELRDLGYSGFLIGESLMASSHPGAALIDLRKLEEQAL